MKNILINIGFLCITILLFFGGIELTLRLTGIQRTTPNPPRIYQRSRYPEISYELLPGISRRAYRATVTTNRLGFRSPELDSEKPLIAILGDSIAFGYGLKDDQTIPARLNQLLPAYNILNTAVPGYDLKTQTAVYTEKLSRLNPDALILIFHFNDLEGVGVGFLDNDGVIRPRGWTDEEKTCDPIEQGILGMLPEQCFLDTHSAFYKAAKKIVNVRYRQERLLEEQEKSKENPLDDDVTQEQLDTYAEDFGQLTRELPPDLPGLFVIWPDRTLHIQARRQLVNIAERYDFMVLDLYNLFGNEVPTLGWDTVHPNAAAAREGATAIYNTLRKNGLVHPF